jgi:hypothetical protein
MTDSQSLSELLAEALDAVEAMGGPERARLADVIGRPAFDRLTSGERGSGLVDRWINAGGKTKPAATRTLAVYIAKIADRADLVDRITNEIGDAFEIPTEKPKKASHSSETKEGAPTPAEDKTQANPAMPDAARLHRMKSYDPGTKKPKKAVKADITMLAKGNDMAGYYRARQPRQRIQKSEL